MNKYDEIIKDLTNIKKLELISQVDYNKLEIEATNLETYHFSKDSLINKYLPTFSDSFFKGCISNAYDFNDNIHTVNLDEILASDSFIKIHFASLYFNTLSNFGYRTCLEVNNTDSSCDILKDFKEDLDVIKNSNISFVILSSYVPLKLINTITLKENNLIIKSDNVSEIAKALNNGYLYAITSKENQEKLALMLKEASESEISEDEKAQKYNDGLLLNPKAIDNAILFRFDNIDIEENNNSYVDYSKDFPNELSTVYKNDGILPLDSKKEIVLIGEFAKNDVFDVSQAAYDYDLNCNYYIHGYSLEEVDNNYLIQDALNKVLNKVALVYVRLNDENKLYDNEYKLIEALHNNLRETIVVVQGDTIDPRLLDISNAVFTVPSVNDFGKTTFDILYGKLPSSFKTVTDLLVDDKVVLNKYAGLQLSSCLISDIKVLDNDIEFVARNESDNIIEPTIFLTLNDNVIGFVKCFLNKHEFKTLSIKLDKSSFEVYDTDLKEYVQKEYEFNLCLTDFDKVKEDINITLDKPSLDKVNVLATNTNVQTIKTNKFKFIVCTCISIYIIAICLLCALNSLVEEAGTMVLFVLCGIVALFYIIYLIVYIKKTKKLKSKPAVDSNIVEMKDMETIKKDLDLVYVTNVDTKEVEVIVNTDELEEVEEVEQDAEETKTEAQEILNPTVENVDFDTFEESTQGNDIDQETIDFELAQNAKEIDLSEIIKSFSKYLISKGITVSIKQLKTLFASFAASKFIVIKSNDKELEKQFITCLQSFLSNKNLSIDLNNYNSFNESVSDSASSMVQFINSSISLQDGTSVLYVENTNDEKFNNVLKPFIVQTKNNSNVFVSINSNKVSLPKNAYFIISDTNFTSYSDLTFEVELEIASVNQEEYEGQVITLSTLSINNLIKSHEDTNYIKENDFKKFDNLYESLASSSLSNRTTLDFEKMYVLLSVLEFDVTESLDILLRGRIIPLIKKSKLYKDNKSEVINITSKIFDDKEYSISLKYLMKEDSEVDSNEQNN